MPDEFVRVRDTRTNEILPHSVPRAHLDIFGYLKEVPSEKRGTETVTVTEPVQPAQEAPVTEPAPKKAAPAKTTTKGTGKAGEK